MTRSACVLGILHQLQGSQFCGFVDDPFYKVLIDELIEDSDFVFEEAAGLRPSIAENRAISLLGPGHYLDVDPPIGEREKYSLAKDTGSDCFIVVPVPGSYRCQIVSEHRKREEIWLQRIQDQDFKYHKLCRDKIQDRS